MLQMSQKAGPRLGVQEKAEVLTFNRAHSSEVAMSEILNDMREAVEHHQAADQHQPAMITGVWADHVERLERDRDALLAAAKILREHAKSLFARWDADELNDSHFGKNLKSLSGWNPGYAAEYDKFHKAIAQAES